MDEEQSGGGNGENTMDDYMIGSDRLRVYFRIEEGELSHTRFERMGVMEKIVLDEKHTFCSVEQTDPRLKTCYGVGLIGEYVWDEPALNAKKGEKFPKLSVGLLTQKKDNRAFRFMEKYDVDKYDMSYTFDKNRAEFIMEPKECMGIAVRMKKTVTVEENVIIAHMSVENVGEKEIDAYEYQHNFVNIDNIKLGPGYELYMPFYKDEGNFDKCVRENYKPVKPHFLVYILKYVKKVKWFEGFMKMKNGTVRWLKPMNGYTFWTITDNIDSQKGLYWRLSHKDSKASVEEHFSFVPVKVVNWGMEHCVCTEAYAPVKVKPGQTCEWERKWIFND